MKFNWPIKGIGLTPGISFVQNYYSNPKVLVDTWYGSTLVKAGQYVYSTFGLKSHGGIDIAAPKNTPVYAIADGFIAEQTGKNSGFGLRISQVINIGDKNIVATYGHFDHFENDFDQQWNFWVRTHPVKIGDIIGYVDSTGFSSGNHLHLTIYEYDLNGNKLNSNNGNFGAVDPLIYLKPRAFLVGYRKHPEKDFIFRMDSMDTLNWFKTQDNLKEMFEIEEVEFTQPLDKPPFPTP